MAYIGKEPADSLISFAKQDFTTSATTSYTLDNAVTNENELALFINFVRQEPTTAYTASGTTLTLTSATASTDDMYCVYLGQAKQTVNAPDGSVGSSQVASTIITGQTAETSIATDDTVLIHDTSAGALRKMTRANFVSGVGGTMTPSFHAYLSSSQTVSDNVSTKAQLDSEIFDSDNAFDSSTNYRFTPQTAGKYFVYSSVRADEGVGDLNKIQNNLSKNGSLITGIGQTSFDARNGGSTDSSSYNAGIVDMNGSSDYIELFVQVDSISGNNSLLNNQGTYLGAYKIIE